MVFIKRGLFILIQQSIELVRFKIAASGAYLAVRG